MTRRFPTPAWTVGYRREWLRGDVLAGVTITAYLIPQVMAYAAVAGLPAVVGLWASIGALVAYALLGTSSQLSVGPESTTSLMTAAAIGGLAIAGSQQYADFAVVLCLLVAGLCLLGWLGRLAFLAELLSRPVLVGYMSGVAVIMMASQLGKLSGIDIVAGADVWSELAFVARHLSAVQAETVALGLVTLAVMILGSLVAPRAPWALIGMLGAAAAVALLDLREQGITVIGTIPSGLPVPGLPQLSLDGVLSLVPGALGVAFVGYTDNILTGRAFANRRDERIDAKRELLALGAANLAAGLMHGFPVSSSGSRTAIGHAVGGRTQLTSLVTVAATVLAVFTLRPLLASFPTAALGAVVVYAAIRLIDIGEFRRLAAFRRTEFAIAIATTVAVLAVGVLPGILVAIVLSMLDLLRRVARPHDAIEGFVPDLAGMHDIDDYPQATLVPGLLVYRYDSPLFFANTEDFRRRAMAAVVGARDPVQWFLLNAEAIVDIDITAVDVLVQIHRELSDRGIVFAIARMKQDLRSDLERTDLLQRIGEDHLFPTLPTAVEAFRRWAAQQQ
jgi:sulfate permease, SulP family